MEAKRSIRSYIGLGWGLPLAAVLALLAAVVFLVLALRPADLPQTEAESLIFNSREVAPGSPVYVDILSLSEPLHRDEKSGMAYYAAENSDHVFCIVCLTEAQFSHLSAQRDVWDGYSSVSLPFRVSGVCAEIPREVRDTFCEIFEMSEEVFEANFGRYCFFDGEPPRPAAPLRVGLLVLAAVFFLVFLLLLLPLLLRLSSAANALVRLEDADVLYAAADELDADETILLAGDRLRLGKRFVFGWRNALAAAWGDLVWCYDRPFPSESFLLARMLVLGTADGKKHRLFFPSGAKKELRTLTEQLEQRAPHLLRGDSAENRAAFAGRCH